MSTIVLDIDGVCTSALPYIDFVGQSYDYPEVRGENLTQYEPAKQWPYVELGLWQVAFRHSRLVSGLAPLEGAMDGIRDLTNMGYKVLLMTSRPAVVQYATMLWAEKYMPLHREIPVLFTIGMDKVDIVRALAKKEEIFMLVDDDPRVVLQVCESRKVRHTVLYLWKYNEAFTKNILNLWGDWSTILELARNK